MFRKKKSAQCKIFQIHFKFITKVYALFKLFFKYTKIIFKFIVVIKEMIINALLSYWVFSCVCVCKYASFHTNLSEIRIKLESHCMPEIGMH